MKYKLTDEPMEYDGVTLYRIQALIDIPSIWVKVGDLGGWVQSKDNLSQCGDCWIFDNAKIYENARMYDNARIYDNATMHNNSTMCDNAVMYGDTVMHNNSRMYDDATMYGRATLYDDAVMYGDATMYGHAMLRGDAVMYGDATVMQGNYHSKILNIIMSPYSITATYPNHMQVGCSLFEIPETKQKAVKIMNEHYVKKEYHEQMWLAAKMCKQWINDNPERIMQD